jgi:hypothetical protein
MNHELRITDTNASSDSKGRTWGLEGNLFWWLVGGIMSGVTLFFVLLVGLKMALTTSFGIAVVPVLVCLAYIFGLRQGKPPGYDRDLLESFTGPQGFSPDPRHSVHLTHPLQDRSSQDV